jgi:DNA-binding CsgD family transcriptional regulator
MVTVQTVGSSSEGLEAQRKSLRASLSEPGADAVERLRELVGLDAEIAAHDEALRLAEVESLARVHVAMSALRQCATPELLIEAAPRELCNACGFTRAMISRVRGSVWDPVALEVRPGFDENAEAFRAYIESVQIPLAHMLLETDLVRRRVPALVTDPANDPHTFQAIVEISRSTSYVAAPILPTRRVIGFFHADRYGEEAPCNEQDRDLLWIFAEHFGLLFERAVLVERLEQQRTHLQQAFTAAAEAIAELNEAELALVRRGPLAEPTSLARTRQNGSSRVDALLTRREREVIELLVTGATNAEAAQRLVVSEGTVKSHLKRILRKLHVTNRSEAVAKYLHIVRLDGDSEDR